MEFTNLFPKVLGVSSLNLTEAEHDMVMKTIKGVDLQTYLPDMEVSKRYAFEFLQNKNIKFLKEKIMQSFKEYAIEVYGSTKQEYQMTTSWLKVFRPEEKGHFHQHRNAMISGLYYPEEVPEGQQSDVVLHDTGNETSYFVQRDDGVNRGTYYVRPLKNRIIFFPASTFHSVNANLTGKTRYSIAFNFVPVGPTGHHDSYTEFR